ATTKASGANVSQPLDPKLRALLDAPEENERIRGQFVREDGSLVHLVLLPEDNVAFVSSDGTVTRREIASRHRPTTSTFSRAGVKRYALGDRVSLHDVIRRVEEMLCAYVRFQHPWQAPLIATWIAGTYVHQMFASYGYLHVTSPTLQCGKTT